MDGRLLLFSDIHALPTLSYEDELTEQDEFYRRTMEVVTENSGTIRVGSASQQERDSAVATMVELGPRLGIQSSPPL